VEDENGEGMEGGERKQERRRRHLLIIKLEWALGRAHTFAYHNIGH